MVDICFRAEDIAAVYKELENTNMTLEEVASKLRDLAGINPVAKVLSNFIDYTYEKAVFKLLNMLKTKQPELYSLIIEFKNKEQKLNEIDNKLMELLEYKTEIENIYKELTTNNVNKVFTGIVKETLPVVNGMLTLTYDPIPINGKYWFLNTNFILKKKDGSLELIDELEYFYGKKFFTGDLNHNGTLKVVYYKKSLGEQND